MTSVMSEATTAGLSLADRTRVDEARDRRLALEREWSTRSATRVRAFVPLREYVPRHRSDATTDVGPGAV